MSINKKIQKLSPRWNAVVRIILIAPWFIFTMILGIICAIVVIINVIFAQLILGKKTFKWAKKYVGWYLECYRTMWGYK